MFMELAGLFSLNVEKIEQKLVDLVRSKEQSAMVCTLFISALGEHQMGRYERAAESLTMLLQQASPGISETDRTFIETLLADCEYALYAPPEMKS